MNKRSNHEIYLILMSLAESMRGCGNTELTEDADRYEEQACGIIVGENQEQIHDDLIEIFIKMRAALAAYHLQHKKFNIV